MIAIIKGIGSNISSVYHALKRLGAESILTDDPKLISSASHIILPGVGHASAGMQFLRSKALDKLITRLTQPILGICLGMQLLYRYSEEGETECLSILPGTVKKLHLNSELTVPHMGWNQLNFIQLKHDLLKNVNNNSHVYFIHSFAVSVNEYSIASTQYGSDFTAIAQHNNFYGVQFHPEKSAKIGEKILENFLNL